MKVTGALVAALAMSLAVAHPHATDAIPSSFPGPDLTSLRGWLAGVYPSWVYVPDEATVHPIPELWTPMQTENWVQVQTASAQLTGYGSVADVLQYNPNPASTDQNELLRSYLGQPGGRPFFLLYENLNGARFHFTAGLSAHGDPTPLIDMNDPYNRAMFLDDVSIMVQQVIVPFQSRYVTLGGRAVIYIWASGAMVGDVAGALAAAKAAYPVAFLGSEAAAPAPGDAVAAARVAALDGFMPYSVGDPLNQGDYLRMATTYRANSLTFRRYINQIDLGTSRKHLLIPTFQAAFDNTRFPGALRPDGTPITTPMYPRTRDEAVLNAQLILNGMTADHIFDPIGPFCVYSEFFEGGAVAQSINNPEPTDHFVGYDVRRLQVLQQFFSPKVLAGFAK